MTSFCPHCGQIHPAEALICPQTGRPLTPPARVAPGAWITLGAVGATLLAVGLWMLAEIAPVKSPIAQAPASSATALREIGQAPTLRLISTQAVVVQPPTQTRVPTQRPLPTDTPVPTVTPLPTDTPVPTATPFPTLAGLTVNAVDDARLVLVPAGEFVMGSDTQSDPYFWGAESPPHRVALNAFWIYETEVTNAQYLKCRAASACPRPRETSSSTRAQYYEEAAYANYPVIQVTWTMALAYCRWAGGRLPTEAEWEKAARGDDSRLFPWGDVAPTGTQANLCDRNCSNGSVSVGAIDDGYSDTSPVGSYPAGRSPYGALDMAGNVWEWVADWFTPGYAAQPLVENPIGPASGERRVMRGGSWFNGVDGLRTVARSSQRPDTALYSGGFRCAQDQAK